MQCHGKPLVDSITFALGGMSGDKRSLISGLRKSTRAAECYERDKPGFLWFWFPEKSRLESVSSALLVTTDECE